LLALAAMEVLVASLGLKATCWQMELSLSFKGRLTFSKKKNVIDQLELA
jgi:hypothetical protein